MKYVKFIECETNPSRTFEIYPSMIYGMRKNKKEKMSSKELVSIIENLMYYDAKKMTNEQLIKDWNVVNEWFLVSKELKETKIPYKTIINLAKSIYNGMQNRKDKMKNKFLINQNSIELCKLISEPENIKLMTPFSQQKPENTFNNINKFIEVIKQW